MGVLDFILDGLERALELERELGVRTVELGPDGRKLLFGEPSANTPHPLTPRIAPASQLASLGGYRTSAPSVPRSPSPSFARDNRVNKVDSVDRVVDSSVQTPKDSKTQTILDLVFLHDRPLAQAGVEMMAKILNALGKPDAPIVIAPPVPEAKVTVVLGGLALKKYFPGMKGEPGQWQKTPEGRDVLITYSPAYILRFGTVTPAVQKIKQDMWLSLKAVKQRLG